MRAKIVVEATAADLAALDADGSVPLLVVVDAVEVGAAGELLTRSLRPLLVEGVGRAAVPDDPHEGAGPLVRVYCTDPGEED